MAKVEIYLNGVRVHGADISGHMILEVRVDGKTVVQQRQDVGTSAGGGTVHQSVSIGGGTRGVVQISGLGNNVVVR